MIPTEPIPFEIPNIDSLGLKQAEGLLKWADSELILELKESDSLLGIYESEVKEYRIPITDIHRFDCKKGFMGAKIEIQASSMKKLQELPGMKQGKLTLKIAKRDYRKAERLQSKVTLELSEQRLRDMDK